MGEGFHPETLLIDISIPSSSMTLDIKPHVIYILHVQLTMKSYTLKKRYSEFCTLHKQLLEVTGCAPPVELPPKYYLLNIFSKPSLIEERRRGLEAYVIGIHRSEDTCWRLSPPWRQFLKLPVYAIGRPMISADNSAIQLSDQSWMRLFHETKSLLQEAKRHVSRRGYLEGAIASQVTRVSSIKGFCTIHSSLEQLSQGLDNRNIHTSIGERELWRRKDLLENMKREYAFLEHIVYNNNQIKHDIPSSIQTWKDCETSFTRCNLDRIPETERTRELSSVGLIHLQKDILNKQDEQLGAFLPILRKQKEIVTAIADELDMQNDMLNELDESVQKTHLKLKSAKKKSEQLK
ncbi:hypothetical protein PNEG_01243 [Pneumocystis murina B123]|uniref:PX domain-containing protein n=1 Tax=Pneumocystis murina (strain B123) TaxID=1069680 RepID=M7P9I9_PNEMU|nr:hypothetical protein PNEG_01243 [Pneumocystis murina B123]EMR10535.1 hypothetical protein PNEG_01243 [Pneumocystis murina B123]